MPQLLITLSIIIFILSLIIKKVITYIEIKKRISHFLSEYFYTDKLYHIDDIACAFKLDNEHLLDILETLEKYNYFKELKKNGVSIVKEYYSLYEIKIILNEITKKVKL